MIELILATAAALTILTVALLAATRLSNHRPDPDDQAPTAHGTWTCPDCRAEVPVTIVAQHLIIARPDPTDVEAHLLQHTEAR